MPWVGTESDNKAIIVQLNMTGTGTIHDNNYFLLLEDTVLIFLSIYFCPDYFCTWPSCLYDKVHVYRVYTGYC